MNKPDSYHAGYESKIVEINGMGWEAARNKFNSENPIGYSPSSPDGQWFAHGEFQALSDKKPN